jgi:hypothetical protein
MEELKKIAIETANRVNATPGNNRFHSYQIEKDLGYLTALIHVLNSAINHHVDLPSVVTDDIKSSISSFNEDYPREPLRFANLIPYPLNDE